MKWKRVWMNWHNISAWVNNERTAWNSTSGCFFIAFWFCVLPDTGSGDFVNGLLKGWNAYDKI